MQKRGQKQTRLKDLYKAPMDPKAYFEELRGESDRACALVACATIAESFRWLLLSRFVALSSPETSAIFDDPHGMLSSFSSRIKMARALGLINKREKQDADIVRSIRNVFAHTFASITFETEEIKTEVLKLKIPEIYGHPKNMTTKDLYIASTMSQYIDLMNYANKLHEMKSGLGRAFVGKYKDDGTPDL